MTEIRNLIDLLQGTKRIIKHQQDIEKLKGESFNVFSILKMESKENETHSAFLAELLNPQGSHLKGNTFLRLFLKVIGNKTIDPNSAKVKVEHYCGERDDKAKTGGRIDIFIWNEGGNSISIENKIYAGDQYAQIQRYCNYSPNKEGINTVYYLTRFGEEPSKESKGNLNVDEDFFCISYKSHVLEWLQQGLKESAEEPILRESIKQYLILIKKLTKTMERKKENELTDIMLKYYEEASYIAEKFPSVKYGIAEKLRLKVLDALSNRLGGKYIVTAGNPTDRTYSHIWIRIAEYPNSPLFFGIESFNGKSNGFFKDGGLYVGTFCHGGEPTEYANIEGNTKKSRWWYNVEQINAFEGEIVNFGNLEVLFKLHRDSEYAAAMVKHIVDEISTYILKETSPLCAFISKQ